MNLLIVSVSHFLHLLATVVWIGGIVMILGVILPSAKAAQASVPAVGGLMKEITKRFTPMANVSILVLVVTGAIIARYDRNFSGVLQFDHPWSVVMLLKHMVVASMIMVHFYRGLILSPRIGRLSAQAGGASASSGVSSQVAGLQKLSLNLVKANFVLAMTALLLTAVSSSL